MEWFVKLLQNPESVAHIVILYALVISLGVKLGRWKIGGKNGIAFGVTWVLFVGIIVGHICTKWLYADPVAAVSYQGHIIHVIKELGLILFVYCIGLQVGPSFFETFKSGGLGMNMLTASLVMLNVLVMLGLYFLGDMAGIFSHPGDKGNLPMMVGVMYGAVTNTPGLGAATGVLKDMMGDAAPVIANGYACAYPLGVVGIILATLSIKMLTKVSYEKELADIRQSEENNPHATPKHLVIKVTNTAVVGRSLEELHQFLNRQFVVTRCIKPQTDEIFVPNRETQLEVGMCIHLVCAEDEAESLASLIGEVTDGTWSDDTEGTDYVSKRLVITKPEINGKTLGKLHVSSIYGVNVTRITRNGMELFAARDLRLQVGDRILVTGREKNIERFKNVVGAHVKHLDHPNVGAIFFGILIGVIVGQIPLSIPGVSMPVKLGLAGGPLVVSILIGAFGYRYKINTYTSTSANLMLREVGLILFLSSVGIQAGASFWDTITQGDGIHYVWMGFLITVIPILICGLYGRLKMKLNYFTLMGLIAGSNTDPPALAFANAAAGNNAPAVGYSTVYPLAMFLRILMAQLVLLFFMA
ncbi:putative transporter [Alloprevotella sp. OH1205_COT-284]|uniref:putative transporter n=1 Tax=Alloprevotella sp. OH1205_COT-284 TaxID=2491043 RepID=UPI000F5ED1A9|nr:putative transporter [Alloprevotella sp. OH1205_COT-284]RRD77337.1 putative transporter [Alloprevotella sp. OH1205_COT-284]